MFEIFGLRGRYSDCPYAGVPTGGAFRWAKPRAPHSVKTRFLMILRLFFPFGQSTDQRINPLHPLLRRGFQKALHWDPLSADQQFSLCRKFPGKRLGTGQFRFASGAFHLDGDAAVSARQDKVELAAAAEPIAKLDIGTL